MTQEPLDPDWRERTYSRAFGWFWVYYPKKRHKPAAFRAWNKLSRTEQREALRGLHAWRVSEQWAKGFIEDPATYLNQRQWEDIPKPATAATEDPIAKFLEKEER